MIISAVMLVLALLLILTQQVRLILTKLAPLKSYVDTSY